MELMDYVGGCKLILLVVTGGRCCYGSNFMHRDEYPSTMFLTNTIGNATQVR